MGKKAGDGEEGGKEGGRVLVQGFSWREPQVSTVYSALFSSPLISTAMDKTLGQELELGLQFSDSVELDLKAIQDLFLQNTTSHFGVATFTAF